MQECLPTVEFVPPRGEVISWNCSPRRADYWAKALSLRSDLLAVCAFVAMIAVVLLATLVSWVIAGVLVVVFLVGGTIRWALHSRIKFCRACGACTKGPWGRQELLFCPSCYSLTDPTFSGSLDLTQASREAAVPRFLAMTVLLAIAEKASVLRFTPEEDVYRIHLVIDEETFELESAPAYIAQGVARTVMAIAGLDISPRTEARNGQITFRSPDRVSVADVILQPTAHGPRVTFSFHAGETVSSSMSCLNEP